MWHFYATSSPVLSIIERIDAVGKPKRIGYNGDIDGVYFVDEVRDMPSPVSLRLSKDTADKIHRIAAIEHRSFAETVRALTEEALKTREFPDIIFVEGPTGRRATFRDGLDVWEIVEPYLLAGQDWSALRQSYPDVAEAKLRAAIRYYESYPDEIEARIALNQAA